MATIIDGKELSKKLKEQMKDRVAQMRQQGIVPKLVVVLVGNNSASEVYVRNKHTRPVGKWASSLRSSKCRRRPPSRSCWMWSRA